MLLCGGYGHYARACFKNRDKFSQNNDKKKTVKFEENTPMVNTALLVQKQKLESELLEMKNKVDHLEGRLDTESHYNYMLRSKGLSVELELARKEKFLNILSFNEFNKVKCWKNRLKHCMKSYEESSRHVWSTVAEFKDLPVSSEVENEACSIAVSRSLAIKIAFEKSMTQWLDKLKEKSSGQKFVITIENMHKKQIKMEVDVFSKVRDVI